MKSENTGKLLEKLCLLEKSKACRKCFLWFFDYPNIEISLNNLSANIGVSKTATRKAVLELEKEGFLIRKELGKIWRISCNKEHYYNKHLKIFSHLKIIPWEYIIEKIHHFIPSSRAIILFGSYRKGDDTEKSDIDIAIEVVNNNRMKISELEKIDIGFRKNVKINLHVFSRNRIDLNLFANISNGIVLDGFLEAKP